jgi:hypothetical protein
LARAGSNGACKATQQLRRGLEAWIEALDRTDQGDADAVLEWSQTARDYLRDARHGLEELPDWPDGAAFAREAESLVDLINRDLDEIESAPLQVVASERFNGHDRRAEFPHLHCEQDDTARPGRLWS